MSKHENSRCENCIIRQMNSFKALKKEELKQMSDSKETKVIKKGVAIFREGERLNGVFCVRNGISKLSKMSDNGRDQIVKIATKGEVLGQRSVIASEATNLSATALEDMEVCFIPKTHIEESLQKSVKQRLAEVLLYLDEHFGQDEDGFLYLQLSRADIADVVGTATELLIRTLTKLKKEEIVHTSGKRIKLIDKKALYNIVEGL